MPQLLDNNNFVSFNDMKFQHTLIQIWGCDFQFYLTRREAQIFAIFSLRRLIIIVNEKNKGNHFISFDSRIQFGWHTRCITQKKMHTMLIRLRKQ